MNIGRSLRLVAVIGGLSLFGFALRAYYLAGQSLWYDEGVSWYVAQMSPAEALAWTAADIQPPLYYLLLWGWVRLAGASEFALRFPSVAFGVLLIPLAARLGRRFFGAGIAPLAAAAMVALSPLAVYYSQEARMYALLALLGGLSSWLWLRLLHDPCEDGFRLRRLLPYVLITAAALYTHYFAVFLAAAHFAYALLVWRGEGRPRRVGRIALWAGAGLVALYLPWLPVLWASYRQDPSYWPGALKLHEALRHVAIIFSAGETVHEQQGLLLVGGYGLLLLLALALLARRSRAPAGRRVLLFLLLWLVLPVLLVVALSYQAPKFNPRYAMLGWPAFVLLIAGGLGELAKGRVRRAFLAAACAFILLSSLFSLRNWFTDPAFSKADFRALARFVLERRAPEDETVILISGHMFPVWAYYYGWEGWTPLPKMETLDVERVITFDAAPELRRALEGYGGAWLVNWQEEVVDPNGIVPLLLDAAGERAPAGDFWGVRLARWRLPPGSDIPLAPPIEHPLQIDFGGELSFLGFSQRDDREVILFWRAERPLQADYRMLTNVVDGHGNVWAEVAGPRPAAYLYPPWRWEVGEVVPGRHSLVWHAGAPAGSYRLQVGLARDGAELDVLDALGNPAGRRAEVEGLTLAQPVPEPLPAEPPLARWGDLALYAARLEPAEAEAGGVVSLSLLWAGSGRGAPTAWEARWRAADGVEFVVALDEPGGEQGLFAQLEAAYGLRSRHRLRVPLEAAAGEALLAVGPRGEAQPVARLIVLPSERLFEVPPVALPLAGDFGGQLRLVGADIRPEGSGLEAVTIDHYRCRPPAGACNLELTLVWQALEPMPVDYTFFVHLLDGEERVTLNLDHPPPRATGALLPGEVLSDGFTLALPSDFSSGRYRLEVGVYDAGTPGLPRLALPDGQDRLIVLAVEVEP